MSLKHRLAAWQSLRQRYAAAFKHAWSRRHDALAVPKLNTDEAAFLPAALALQTKPVSPMGRWVGRVLMLLIAVLLIWSIVGKLDIVVSAQGKVITLGHTKTIASVDIAKVYAIHVQEGQLVKAGDVLVELDTRMNDAEQDKAEYDREAALLQVLRSRALLESLTTGKAPVLTYIEEIQPERLRDAKDQVQAQWSDYVAQRNRFDSEIRHYNQALPLVTQQAKDYAELAATRDVSQHAALEKTKARMELESQLANARNQRTALTAQTRKLAQEQLEEGVKVLQSRGQDVEKTKVQGDLFKLVAPVNGTVQQLTVHTVGGVVPAAQPLMQIVPSQDTVEVEAFIENKDVGFVREGQAAQVKIAAFEYTSYGTVPGRVSHVSRDAIQDEKLGLIYSVKIKLDRSTLTVQGRQVKLTPGMSSTVDIKTGERRVIEYVLSPLVDHAKESLRER